MLDMVHKNCEEGKESWGHSRSVPSGEILGESAMSMFFDELCLALKGKSIAPFIKDWIQRQFASRFVNFQFISETVAYFPTNFFLCT